MSRLSLTGDGRDKWDIRLQSYIGSAIRSVVGISFYADIRETVSFEPFFEFCFEVCGNIVSGDFPEIHLSGDSLSGCW